MWSPVTLVRNLSVIFKNLQARSAELWNSDRSRHAWDWVTNRLKQADSRIREFRLASPEAFWRVLLGIVLFAAAVAIVLLWAQYHRNRQDIVPIATFVGAAVLAYAALKQASTASNRHFAQTEADRQRRIVESFSKAVEQLGSDQLEVRVGAIFALERLSRESADDYWTIMEVLAAFVRERMKYTTIAARLSERAYFLWLAAGRPEGRSNQFWAEAVRIERLEEIPSDIAAILTVIKRRGGENRRREEDNEWRFDLSGVHLSGAYLEKIYLARANLSEAHLEGGRLSHANFEKATLTGAHFGGADLRYAHFEMADLDGAHFEDASLHEAHLEGVRAHLSEPHFEAAKLVAAHLKGAELVGPHFEGANLVGAHLEGAILRKAHFERAELVGAQLEGADLSTAEGLTHDQLVSAYGDHKTKVPEGIRPQSWPPLMVEVNATLPFTWC